MYEQYVGDDFPVFLLVEYVIRAFAGDLLPVLGITN
jgi:hypothetical protein